MCYFHVVKLKSGRFITLNGRVILFGILCVLFVVAAFGQEQSDPNIVTVTEQINIADLNNNVEKLGDAVKKLTESTEKLSGNVGKLTESVNSLNTRVAVLEERTQGTAKTVHVILASFIGPLVVAILAAIIIHLITRKNSEGRAAATNTTQVNQSGGEIAPVATASSRFPEGEELKEYLKSDSFTTKEPI